MPRTALLCLLAFALWPVLLVTAIGAFRVSQVLARKVAPNGFPSGTPHGGDLYWRLNRAHINALESLPVFAAIVLAGALAHVDAPTFDTLAEVAVGARIGQSLVHVAGSTNHHVNVRFSFFVTQLVCFVLMAARVAGALGAG